VVVCVLSGLNDFFFFKDLKHFDFFTH